MQKAEQTRTYKTRTTKRKACNHSESERRNTESDTVSLADADAIASFLCCPAGLASSVANKSGINESQAGVQGRHRAVKATSDHIARAIMIGPGAARGILVHATISELSAAKYIQTVLGCGDLGAEMACCKPQPAPTYSTLPYHTMRSTSPLHTMDGTLTRKAA